MLTLWSLKTCPEKGSKCPRVTGVGGSHGASFMVPLLVSLVFVVELCAGLQLVRFLLNCLLQKGLN